MAMENCISNEKLIEIILNKNGTVDELGMPALMYEMGSDWSEEKIQLYLGR